MRSTQSPRVGVVGGGILGVAVARQIAQTLPGSRITVFEKETALGRHQTGRNSGVVHAGLYYQPGSMKATLCRRGATLLLDFVRSRSLSLDLCGKCVVAVRAEELSILEELHRRAVANGVPGVRKLTRAELTEIEPDVTGLAAIHSPSSAIVDYGEITASLADDVRGHGGEIHVGTEVTSVRETGSKVKILTSTGTHVVDTVVACAGLQSDRLARASNDERYPAIVPFSGDYYVLSPDKAAQVRGLIYPVPDPRVPFLGVHLTKRLDGSVVVGPNALPALGREAYGRRDLSFKDISQVLGAPPFWRFAKRYVAVGVKEALNTMSRKRVARAASMYLAGIEAGDLTPGPRGIRAQAIGRDGGLVDDFVIAGSGRIMHVRNAPSPAATSSMAIAEWVAAQLASALSG